MYLMDESKKTVRLAFPKNEPYEKSIFLPLGAKVRAVNHPF